MTRKCTYEQINFPFALQALSRYEPNGPMRFLIAIVLGTLMFQGSPLPLPRDKHVRTQWNVENTAMEHAFDHAREKRSIKGAVKGPKSGQTNDRIVRIYHAYYYFLHVSNNGKVGGTKDMVNGNGESANLKVVFIT